jgi:hypothetical protein
LIKLGLNFDQAKIEFGQVGINSVMTRVMVLSAKTRRNEWVK